MGTVLAFRIFAGSQFMFSRQEGEVLKMDLYILSFCIPIFAGRRFVGTVFLLWGVEFYGEMISNFVVGQFVGKELSYRNRDQIR